MIFIESDKEDGEYRETKLKEGDAVVLFTDVNRVAFWRDNRYLFWSPLPELAFPLFPVTDIKLYYDDLEGGTEEFREKVASFAEKAGFSIKRKKMSFGGNILGVDIPYTAFEFIKEGVIENENRDVGYCSTYSQVP